MNNQEAISRQAVLETLDDMDNALDEDRTVENYKELLKECYEVLPSVNPQPCEDAISRQAVFEQINCWIGSGEYRYTNATHYLTERVKHISPVNPQEPNCKDCDYKEWLKDEIEPKTGHWIMSEDGLYRPICDNCGAHPWKGYIPTVEEATEVFKYCPNCGCRMVEPQESEVGYVT